MQDIDAVQEAVDRLEAAQEAFMKSVRWRTWAIAGWAVAAVFLAIVIFGYSYADARTAEARYQNEELLKLVDRFNTLAAQTNRPERVMVTYGKVRPPVPATVTTVPVAPSK